MGILSRVRQFFRMSGEPLRKEEIIGPVPKTSGYQPVDTRWFRRPDDLPPLTWLAIEQMLVDPTIRLGLAMRAAPLRNAEFAYKEKDSEDWTPGIRASTPEVGAYVYRQFKKIWRELDGLLIAQLYGWSACEVVHHLASSGGTRFVEISRLVPRHPRDTRCLIKDGDICGVRFLRIVGEPQSHVDLAFPKAIFHRHAPQAGRHYGNTILEGAYSPFADKWGNGGALKLRRLVMQQSAISGRKLYYPDGFTDLPIGDSGSVVSVPNRDVARMIVEQMLSGGVSSFPSTRDAQGNRVWEMEEAKALEGLQHILQYPKDLDVEELRGMEIPDDILTAEASGAWEGKKVPMMAFYGGLDSWLGSLVREICVQQMDYLVLMNFGPGHWYEATTKPLAEQAMDQAKANEPKQQGAGYISPEERQARAIEFMGERPAQQQRMSLDAAQAVGEGVLSAAELVKAARVVIGNRLSTEDHQYSSTQFNLTGDLAFQVRELGYRIPFDDLADDGREENPHITVKFGLHTNDAEEVRTALADKAPVAVQFGPASYFASEEYDVVKIDVIGKGLRELNAAIAEALPNTNTHPEYKPHVTIAYVKPGLGEKYAATLNDMEGRTAVFDRLTFSDKSRAHTSIPLTAKAIRFSAE